jgi:hypothetical protein
MAFLVNGLDRCGWPIARAGAIGWISRRFSKLWIDVLFSAIVL